VTIYSVVVRKNILGLPCPLRRQTGLGARIRYTLVGPTVLVEPWVKVKMSKHTCEPDATSKKPVYTTILLKTLKVKNFGSFVFCDARC
jgi:hypothetical protein